MGVFERDTAYKVSLSIIDRGTIQINFDKKFVWTSGVVSPFYCDNRKLFSVPMLRNFIVEEIINVIKKNWGRYDAIGGVATGGIPPAVLVAHHLYLPFFYVRPKGKMHGLLTQVEGIFPKEISNAILIEDVISSGSSLLAAYQAVKDVGINVLGAVCIFSYDFPEVIDKIQKHGINLIALTNFEITIKVAMDRRFISESDYLLLMDWYKNFKFPSGYSE